MIKKINYYWISNNVKILDLEIQLHLFIWSLWREREVKIKKLLLRFCLFVMWNFFCGNFVMGCFKKTFLLFKSVRCLPTYQTLKYEKRCFLLYLYQTFKKKLVFFLGSKCKEVKDNSIHCPGQSYNLNRNHLN